MHSVKSFGCFSFSPFQTNCKIANFSFSPDFMCSNHRVIDEGLPFHGYSVSTAEKLMWACFSNAILFFCFFLYIQRLASKELMWNSYGLAWVITNGFKTSHANAAYCDLWFTFFQKRGCVITQVILMGEPELQCTAYNYRFRCWVRVFLIIVCILKMAHYMHCCSDLN